jgi:NagD protein
MRFTDFDAILFDMDGTLYREHHALPGAAEVVALLKQLGKPMACVTNNSANTAAELSQRLAKMGVAVPPEGIFTACHAMADELRTKWKRPRVFNFAGRALPVEMGGDAEWVDQLGEPCDVVAVGTHMRENATAFDFERSIIGLNLLKAGADLLVGCADRVFPIQGGGVEFGSGSWGTLFAFAANLPPQRVRYVGKPEASFFQSLGRRFGVDPKRCLIIGDNLESDISGGLNAGMTTALLLTGITRRGDLAQSPIQPHAVFEDLPELIAQLG